MPRLAPLFTAQGYAFVVQDVRGKFRSEGDDIPFVNEVLDGYDTLEWIVGQAWSNGRVGMFGDSYYGYTQWACVASGHPALRAICPRCTGADVVDLPRPGSDEVPLMLMASYLAEHWVGRDAYDFEIDWTPRPLLDVFEPIWEALGGRSHGFDLSYPHPVPLRRFPTGHPFDARPVPTLQTMGWFDNIAPWQWDDHERLARRPDWSRLEYLHIDAVDHEIYHHADTPITRGDRPRRQPGGARRAAAALRRAPRSSSSTSSCARAGRSTRCRRCAGARSTATGRAPSAGRPPGAVERTLYLGPDGTLATEAPDAAEASWTHDPDDLVPSKVDNPFAFLQQYPDEREYGERDGRAGVRAARRSRRAARARGPDRADRRGALHRPGDGRVRAAARRRARRRRPLHRARADRGRPGRPGHARAHLALAHRLPAARRATACALHLFGSDFPEFVPHPGTGENRWLAAETRTNEQTVRLGGDEPARLTITVLP